MQQLFDKNNEAKHLACSGYDPWFVNCYSSEFTGVVRFDCMFDKDNNIKLVEANTNWPDGLLMHDITYSALDTTGEKNTTHLDLFLQFFEKDQHIFILYEEGGFIDPHYLEHEKLKENGYHASIGTFEKLVFKNGWVYYNDIKIEHIRLSMNSGRFSKEQYDLLKNSQVKFINTFDLAWLADKSLLENITNELIMKTHRLTYENRKIFINKKDNYVLKPTNLNEWIGVIIWPDTTQEERENALIKGVNENYLLQEFITISSKKATLYQDWTTVNWLFYYDYCPHLFYKKGKLMGIWHTLVRYSTNKIVNVLRGWAIGYAKH